MSPSAIISSLHALHVQYIAHWGAQPWTINAHGIFMSTLEKLTKYMVILNDHRFRVTILLYLRHIIQGPAEVMPFLMSW